MNLRLSKLISHCVTSDNSITGIYQHWVDGVKLCRHHL